MSFFGILLSQKEISDYLCMHFSSMVFMKNLVVELSLAHDVYSSISIGIYGPNSIN